MYVVDLEINDAIRELRKLFSKQPKPLDAYVISAYDEHANVIVEPVDRRLEYITGAPEVKGIAVVTHKEAKFWTKSERYYLSKMELRPTATSTTTELTSWLGKIYPGGSVLGFCGTYVPNNIYRKWYPKFQLASVELIDIEVDLVNSIWTSRPKRNETEFYPISRERTGLSVATKLELVRNEMRKNNVDCLILSELGDIAWLLNVRGSDFHFNPVCYSFLIMDHLQLHLFYNGPISTRLTKHFFFERLKAISHNYQDFYVTLKTITQDLPHYRFWISSLANYRIYNIIPESKRHVEISPVSAFKSVKTNAEASGIIEAHVYDGYALCKFFCWLQAQIKNKRSTTELTAARKLETIKSENRDYVGPSFLSISASGMNTTKLKYSILNIGDHIVSSRNVYICSSGSHYKCGSTNISRTFHFGDPSDFERECYTRIFKGLVCIGTHVFPQGTQCSSLEVLLKKSLWQSGLDYSHSSGNSVGSFLNAHEDPIGFHKAEDIGLMPNMFLSQEPGVFNAHFGIKLGCVAHVMPHRYSENDKISFLKFEDITLCPYQSSMLVPSLMTEKEIQYLNAYHRKVRTILCPVFQSEKDHEAYSWMMKMTEPLVT